MQCLFYEKEFDQTCFYRSVYHGGSPSHKSAAKKHFSRQWPTIEGVEVWRPTFGVDKERPAELENVGGVTGQPSVLPAAGLAWRRGRSLKARWAAEHGGKDGLELAEDDGGNLKVALQTLHSQAEVLAQIGHV